MSVHPALHRPPPCPRPRVPIPVPAEQWWWRLAALAKLALAPTCKPWLANPRPSWRQTTIASSVPQPSPQTRPQRSSSPSPAPTATSTRPSKRLRPPLSRICRERQWQRHRHHERCSCCWGRVPQRILPRQPGPRGSTWMGPGARAARHEGRSRQELSRARHNFW